MRTTWFSLVLLLALGCGGSGKSDSTMTGAGPDTDPQPTDPVEPTDPVDEPDGPADPVEPDGPDPAEEMAELLKAEQLAYNEASAVFGKYCGHCHSKDGKKANAKKLGEFNLTEYPFTGEHNTAADVRAVLGIGGGKATMPLDKPGSVKGDDLALIADWAVAWDDAETGGAH